MDVSKKIGNDKGISMIYLDVGRLRAIYIYIYITH